MCRGSRAERRGLFENHPFAQAESPYALKHHGYELAHHLRTAKHGACPADEPGTEGEVPKVKQNEQGNAAPEIAGSLEGYGAVHQEIERTGARHGNAVCKAGCQPKKLHNSKYAEFNEGLRNGNAVVSEGLLDEGALGALSCGIVCLRCGMFCGPFHGAILGSMRNRQRAFHRICKKKFFGCYLARQNVAKNRPVNFIAGESRLTFLHLRGPIAV